MRCARTGGRHVPSVSVSCSVSGPFLYTDHLAGSHLGVKSSEFSRMIYTARRHIGAIEPHCNRSGRARQTVLGIIMTHWAPADERRLSDALDRLTDVKGRLSYFHLHIHRVPRQQRAYIYRTLPLGSPLLVAPKPSPSFPERIAMLYPQHDRV